MKRTVVGFVVAGFAGMLLFANLWADEEKPKYTTKEVMGKAHKQGGDELLKKAQAGTASKEQLEELVVCYTSLSQQKPPKGDEKGWKEKTEALLKSSKALAKDGKDKDAQAALGKAANCMACHRVHRAS